MIGEYLARDYKELTCLPKSKSCLTKLIAFSDRIIKLVDDKNAVDTVHLDFSKVSNKVFHIVLLEKERCDKMIIRDGL